MKSMSTILVGVDGSAVAGDAFREACTLAGTFGSTLHLAWAIPGSETFELAAAEARGRLDGLLTDATQRGVTVSEALHIRSGNPVDTLLSVSSDVGADVVVLGAGEKTTLDRVILGSVAEEVTRRSPTPVWLVRPGQAHDEFRTLLCAVDPSASAQEALAGAIFLARTFVAKLLVLTVTSGDDDALERARLDASTRSFDLHGIEHEFLVRRGKPSIEILEAAYATGCDILLMGTEGREGLTGWLRRNTVEKVLRDLPCSVVTFRA